MSLTNQLSISAFGQAAKVVSDNAAVVSAKAVSEIVNLIVGPLIMYLPESL